MAPWNRRLGDEPWILVEVTDHDITKIYNALVAWGGGDPRLVRRFEGTKKRYLSGKSKGAPGRWVFSESTITEMASALRASSALPELVTLVDTWRAQLAKKYNWKISAAPGSPQSDAGCPGSEC